MLASAGLAISAFALIQQQFTDSDATQAPSEEDTESFGEDTNFFNEHVTATVELALIGVTLVSAWVAWSPHRNVLDKATSIKESWNQFYQNVDIRLQRYEKPSEGGPKQY